MTEGPLTRAIEATRQVITESWTELSADITARARATITPASPVLTYGHDGGADRDERGSRTWVSTRVLITMLRHALETDLFVASNITIDIDIDDDRHSGTDIQLTCSYGQDLVDLAEQARERAQGVLTDLLITGSETSAPIDVEVVDVVDGDPRYV